MSHPLMNGENISWLTGRRAGAKGSVSFSWIRYWKLVSLGEPVLADTESVTVCLSSLGAWNQRRGPWSISCWLLLHNPTVYLKEPPASDAPVPAEDAHSSDGEEIFPGEPVWSSWAAQTLPGALRHATHSVTASGSLWDAVTVSD